MTHHGPAPPTDKTSRPGRPTVSEFGLPVAVLTGEARVAERMEALWAGVLRELEGGR